MNRNFVYKDDYKRFLNCPKIMWIIRHGLDKNLQKWVKKNLTFLDKDFQEIFENLGKNPQKTKAETGLDIRIISGLKFENLIVKYFSKKSKIFNFDKINRHLSPQEKSQNTQKIIAKQLHQGYSQPYFAYQNYVTKCDLLWNNQDGSYDLIEIKAVNKIEGKRNREYQNDLSYQCWILKKLKFKIKNAYILHFNKEYLHQKSKIDLEKLYHIETKFNEVAVKKPQLENKLEEVFQYLFQDFETIKPILLDQHCKEEREWEELNYCTFLIKKIKSKYNWLQLHNMRRKDKAQIFQKNLGKELDLERWEDITLLRKAIAQKSYKSQWKWERIIQTVKFPGMIVDDDHLLHQELKKYTFPIYFYDFESAQFSIPQFQNTIPWLQVPFQYSIHILKNANYNLETQAEIVHLEFITKSKYDPRSSFIKNFCQDIQKFGKGTYVAYHTSFEKMILKDLLFYKAEVINSKDKLILQKIIEESRDLKNFFASFNIYHPDFYGSLSIKKTLPALVPEINYEKLKIKQGDQASALYFNYIYQLTDQAIWKKFSKDLRAYCCLDTWAMILIYQKIKDLAK